jgi:tetratricopeptide (TPR) repeat protein
MGRDPAGARAGHRKALELISRWVAADPDNANAQQYLATTLYYEATCARHAGDRAGAAAGYRRCLEIREKLATDPKAKIPQIELMLAQARCGQHDRASAIARELAARSPDNEMIGFQAACGFALSVGAVRDGQSPALMAAVGAAPVASDALLIRDYVDRAIDCLRRAKARGFSDVVGLETDPDLEPIRDEPAFRALITEFPPPAAKR